MSNKNTEVALNVIGNIFTLANHIDLAHNGAMGMGKYFTTLINHLRKIPNDARAIENLVEDETLNLCAKTMAASEDMLKEAKKTLAAVTDLICTNMKEPNRGQINLN